MSNDCKPLNFFKDESNAEYHGNKVAISKSRLSRFSVCPAYFKFHEDEPPKRSDDLTFGAYLHKLVLEPDSVDDEFAVAPTVDRRTKAGKEALDEFARTVGDREIVTGDMVLTAIGMKEAVFANSRAVKLLRKNTIVEQSAYFTDEVTGEACKCRPDARKHIVGRVVLTDLKTCRSASETAFSRDAERYGYDLQAYMYRYGISRVLGIPPSEIDFIFVAVEKTPPYLVNIFKADESFLESGAAKYREYMDTYHYCKESGNWYGLNGRDNQIINLSIGGQKNE